MKLAIFAHFVAKLLTLDSVGSVILNKTTTASNALSPPLGIRLMVNVFNI